MKILRPALVVVLLLSANLLSAGPYSDALGKKLVASTTAKEKASFVRWLFVAMSLHPDLTDMAAITPAQREAANKEIAALMRKMLTETCVKEAKLALRHEGQAAFEAAFSIFGEMAAEELFSNPKVNEGIAELEKYVDGAAIATALGNDLIAPAAPAPAAGDKAK
jgi:hypothetical protein